MLQTYSTARGGFNPPPQPPKKTAARKRLRASTMTPAVAAALSNDAAAPIESLDEQPDPKVVYRDFRRFSAHKVLSRHAEVLRQRLAKVRHASCTTHESQPNGVHRKLLSKTAAGSQRNRTRRLF